MGSITRWKQFFRQPDLRANPVRAVWRRLCWRWHWRHSTAPIVLRNWWQGLQIQLPYSGCAAQVFYRQFSNPEIVRWMERELQSGMNVLDVGAHIGEYALAAARLVGPAGRVLAIEPQADLCEAISINAASNKMPWLSAHPCAIGVETGRAQFQRDPRGKGGFLVHKAIGGDEFITPVFTLDAFCREQGLQRVEFIKLDAGGNELAALQGGAELLARDNAPMLVVKLYHADVVRERFGAESLKIPQLLEQWGYRLFRLTACGLQPFDGQVEGYGIPVLASKDQAVLKSAHVG